MAAVTLFVGIDAGVNHDHALGVELRATVNWWSLVVGHGRPRN